MLFAQRWPAGAAVPLHHPADAAGRAGQLNAAGQMELKLETP
jgi:hypothetical protein